MLYTIVVKETLTRLVDVEASSKEEAMEKVEKMYDSQEIVLDSDDIVSANIYELYSNEDK